MSVDVPAAGHAEVPITAFTSIDVSIAGRDPIGCPISSATFIDPRAIVLDVTEGEARAIRAGTTLRLGGLAVRYDGMGERRTTTGDRALLFLTAAPGTADERAFQCSPDAPCSDGGLAIELVSFEGTFTTLRVRAAPATP